MNLQTFNFNSILFSLSDKVLEVLTSYNAQGFANDSVK